MKRPATPTPGSSEGFCASQWQCVAGRPPLQTASASTGRHAPWTKLLQPCWSVRGTVPPGPGPAAPHLCVPGQSRGLERGAVESDVVATMAWPGGGYPQGSRGRISVGPLALERPHLRSKGRCSATQNRRCSPHALQLSTASVCQSNTQPLSSVVAPDLREPDALAVSVGRPTLPSTPAQRRAKVEERYVRARRVGIWPDPTKACGSGTTGFPAR